MEKRVILATILSTIVILLWWLWFTPQTQREFPRKKPSQEVIQKAQPVQVDTETSTQKYKSKDYILETPFAIVTFNTSGAKIKNYHLKEGCKKEKLTDLILHSIDNSYEPQNFVTLPERNFKCISITSNSITFTTEIDTLTSPQAKARSVVGSVGMNRVKLQKKYILKESGVHLLEFQLENFSPNKKQFECELILGPGVGCEPAKRKDEIQLTKVVTLSRINKSSIKKLKEGNYNISDCKWLALENRYYFSAVMLLPMLTHVHCTPDMDSSRPSQTIVRKNGLRMQELDMHTKTLSAHSDDVQPVITDANITKVGSEKLFAVKLPIKTELQPYQKTQWIFQFYVGAKKYSTLKELQVGFENLIDFGFFAPLGKLAFSALQFFYKVTGNYGIAIIILTLIMQIILLPLSMKSFQSAKAMRVLQPKIRELQLKYKDDPKRLNTEIMYLYKSQKVNPLGGCLPMILQLPIFWALFTVLSNAYELKNALFVLWIKDLSSPDLLFTVGTLPIRLLPLLMGVAMLVQQKFSGTSVDPSQKTFTYIMPVMFTFIFWNFPSGLVLYWLTNSVLSIATQWIIVKQTL